MILRIKALGFGLAYSLLVCTGLAAMDGNEIGTASLKFTFQPKQPPRLPEYSHLEQTKERAAKELADEKLVRSFNRFQTLANVWVMRVLDCHNASTRFNFVKREWDFSLPPREKTTEKLQEVEDAEKALRVAETLRLHAYRCMYAAALSVPEEIRTEFERELFASIESFDVHSIGISYEDYTQDVRWATLQLNQKRSAPIYGRQYSGRRGKTPYGARELRVHQQLKEAASAVREAAALRSAKGAQADLKEAGMIFQDKAFRLLIEQANKALQILKAAAQTQEESLDAYKDAVKNGPVAVLREYLNLCAGIVGVMRYYKTNLDPDLFFAWISQARRELADSLSIMSKIESVDILSPVAFDLIAAYTKSLRNNLQLFWELRDEAQSAQFAGTFDDLISGLNRLGL